MTTLRASEAPASATPSLTTSATTPITPTTSFDQVSPIGGDVVPLPLISHNVATYASASVYPPTHADDYTATTMQWRSTGRLPVWLAYDLSSVPPAQRQSNLVVWYNADSYEYTYSMDAHGPSYNMPMTYTLESNSAVGGGSPPINGWTPLARVNGNLYHSRQHLIALNGANWLRLTVTGVRGAALNDDATLKMDVYDASRGTADDFIFYGDSITADAMNHNTTNAGATDWLGALIHTLAPAHYPVAESGGIPFLTSADGAAWLPTWLALFPGHFVALSYGTNDANGCVAPDTVYKNFVTMIQTVMAAGKIPLIPHIPYGATANIRACGPAINARIDALYHAYPHVLAGPDLWSFFKARPALIGPDGIHPTDAGDAALRQEWATLIARRIYGVAG